MLIGGECAWNMFGWGIFSSRWLDTITLHRKVSGIMNEYKLSEKTNFHWNMPEEQHSAIPNRSKCDILCTLAVAFYTAPDISHVRVRRGRACMYMFVTVVICSVRAKIRVWDLWGMSREALKSGFYVCTLNDLSPSSTFPMRLVSLHSMPLLRVWFGLQISQCSDQTLPERWAVSVFHISVPATLCIVNTWWEVL